VIHLRVVSPPDITSTLMPALRAEPAVMNLTLLSAAASNPNGDAVHFDVLNGAANEVIGRLRDLGLEQRGSIVMENIDTSMSALADRVTARSGRFQQFAPVWAEIEARLTTEGTYPPSWFSLLVIAGLIGAIGILTNSQILIVGAMVVGPDHLGRSRTGRTTAQCTRSRAGRSHPARMIQSPPSGCILCHMGVRASTTLIATGAIVRCTASWQPEDSDLAQQACGPGRRA